VAVKSLIRSVLTLGAVLAGSAPARAWGEDGHVIVARVAELNLSADAQNGIKKLLGPIGISHPRIATFADFVRHNRDYPQYKSSAPWHYVNIPVDAEGVTGYDPDRDSPKGKPCVVTKIKDFQKVLADKTRPSDERLEALMFLVHLVGDVHQPLHCGDRGDSGGNGLKVKYLGHGGNHLNLHAVWDDNLVKENMKRLDAAGYAAKLHAKVSDEKDRALLSAGAVEDWATESFLIAKQSAYVLGGATIPKTGPTPDLDDEYIDRNAKEVEKQLLRGGLRLARLLNEAFKQ
jgi:hypothetical protein